MKRFVFKTLLLSLPIIIIAVSMECLLRNIPNDYTYKKHYLDKHAAEIHVLILGASHGYFGIDPVYFSLNTFNASHVSQTLDMDFALFDKYQNSYKELKVLILPISYFTLWGKLKESPEAWRIKNYALYYGIDTGSSTDYSELLNGKLGINMSRLYNRIINKENDIACSTLGWGTSFRPENACDLVETGKEAALRHKIDNIDSEKNATLLSENKGTLNSLAERCNKINVKIIFITTPAFHTYWEKLNAEQLNVMIETIIVI